MHVKLSYSSDGSETELFIRSSYRAFKVITTALTLLLLPFQTQQRTEESGTKNPQNPS